MPIKSRPIFQAIHEGKWLSIEYRNKKDHITKYWIGIRRLDAAKRTLSVDGLHLGIYTLERLDVIYLDSILSAQVLDGTYYPVNQALVDDIEQNPHKYREIFGQTDNLKILNYLEDCSRMDTTPYETDFSLIKALDQDKLKDGALPLNEEQFRTIVRDFQNRSEEKRPGQRLLMKEMAMNVMSIHTSRGLYVLAYRRLYLDVKGRLLRADQDVTICTEFTIDGRKESIRRFLDGEDYELLRSFDANQEAVKDALMKISGRGAQVDDMPYVIGLAMETVLDLHREYNGILSMYQKGEPTVPIRAFFGELLGRPRSSRPSPIALLDKKINLDQLLAVHNGMKFPVAYIQGPPGTGKTNTIINTIVTAFFCERTVLFTSYNNHPIDGVAEKLSSLSYQGKRIPFPMIRLGNQGKVLDALGQVRDMYEKTKDIVIFASTLERNKEAQAERAKALSALLKKYGDLQEMEEREETIRRLADYSNAHGTTMQQQVFGADLRDRQLKKVQKKMEKIGTITEEDALNLAEKDVEELKKYLYYVSAKYIQRIGEPKNAQFKDILFIEDPDIQVKTFENYLKDSDNLKNFQQIFPVIATTCISAHKLGAPEPLFDMTIMDEASQCNTAAALVPILRGKRLMLVGDPQQLNPVILLDENVNRKLMEKYRVPEEYDYRKNSVYKAYLACDPVSDEVLLRSHYRCHEKIIGFNNKKYYNSRLEVRSKNQEKHPLQFIDMEDGRTDRKNTAPAETEAVIQYAMENRDKTIGVITPFVNQKNAIERRLREEGLEHVGPSTPFRETKRTWCFFPRR